MNNLSVLTIHSVQLAEDDSEYDANNEKEKETHEGYS